MTLRTCEWDGKKKKKRENRKMKERVWRKQRKSCRGCESQEKKTRRGLRNEWGLGGFRRTMEEGKWWRRKTAKGKGMGTKKKKRFA